MLGFRGRPSYTDRGSDVFYILRVKPYRLAVRSRLCACASDEPPIVSLDGERVLMLDLLKDLWGFASERKKFWLVPLIGTLLVLSVLIAIAEFSTVAPFIYTLF